jgi:hypothetical protein
MRSSSIRAFTATVVAAATALVGAHAAAAQATAEIIMTRSEAEVFGENVCSGEEIFLTGESRALLRITETPSGQTTLTVQGNFLLMGSGLPSGQRYVMPFSGAATIELVGQETMVMTQVVNAQIITAGGKNDVYGHALVHITVVDGRATAEVDEVKIDCK